MYTPSGIPAQAALLLWALSLPYCTGWLYQLDMPKFTQVSKFLAAAQIFIISCENSKILSRLLSVLSLSRKFVYDHCRIPIRHFFSQSRRLLTKFFWKCNNCKWEMQMLWIRGQGAIKRGCYALSAFPSFIKPGTRQTGLTGRFQKSFDMNSWHLLRKSEKL